MVIIKRFDDNDGYGWGGGDQIIMDDIIPKKILVTGVSGFIGSNLLRTLIYKKNTSGYPYQIRCLTRDKKSLDNLNVNEKDIEIVEGDLSSFDDCLRALEGVDIVY